jgi:DNA-binding NarL/FixJ family response regulator
MLLSRGNTVKEIATLLNLACKTVDFHKWQAMQKLGTHKLAQLVRLVVAYELEQAAAEKAAEASA